MKTKLLALKLLVVCLIIFLSSTAKSQAFQPDSVYLVQSNFPTSAVIGSYWKADVLYLDTIVDPSTDTVITPNFQLSLYNCMSVEKDSSYIFDGKYFVKFTLSGYISGCGNLNWSNQFNLRACNGAGHCSAIDTFYLNVRQMSGQYLPYMVANSPSTPFQIAYPGSTLQTVRIPLNQYFDNPIKETTPDDTLYVDSLVYGTQQVLQCDTIFHDSSVVVPIDTVPLITAWGTYINMIPVDTVQVASGDSIIYVNDTILVPVAWVDSIIYGNDTLLVPVYTCYNVTVIDSLNILDTLSVPHLHYPSKSLDYALLLYASPFPPYGSIFSIHNDTLIGFLNEVNMPGSHTLDIPIWVGNDSSGMIAHAAFNYLQNQSAYLQGANFNSVASPGDNWVSQFTIGDTIQTLNDTTGLTNNFDSIPSWVQVTDTSYFVAGPHRQGAVIGDVYVKQVTLSGVVPTVRSLDSSYHFILSWCDWAGLCTQPTTYTLDIVTGKKVLSEDHLSFYPNPVSDKLQVRGLKNIDKIFIYNLVGSLVLTSSLSEIDVSNFPSGVYLLQVKQENGTLINRKFTKQ